jgi:hypothetical protein
MADENAKMTDCYYEKKDWRACKDEVGLSFNVIQDWTAAHRLRWADGEIQTVLEGAGQRQAHRHQGCLKQAWALYHQLYKDTYKIPFQEPALKAFIW